MTIDNNLILKLEHLSRLQLSATEREQIKGDLNNILSMIEKIDELDLTDIEPLQDIIDNVNVLREDEVSGHVSREEALKNAPKADEKYFLLPKVVK